MLRWIYAVAEFHTTWYYSGNRWMNKGKIVPYDFMIAFSLAKLKGNHNDPQDEMIQYYASPRGLRSNVSDVCFYSVFR